MKKTTSNHRQLTPAQEAEIDALAALPDDQIDTQDIPEGVFTGEKHRGLFYRPIKQQITLRLDADLIAWFKSQISLGQGDGYQTNINRALREYVVQHSAKGAENATR